MFVVIRLQDKESIKPEYLKWYLNLNRTQNILSRLARGSALPSLTRSHVNQLEVEIPSLQKQEFVVKIEELKKKEAGIVLQLHELKEKETEKLILKAIK